MKRIVATVSALAAFACASLAPDPAREEVAAAERAFAADCAARGIRASFIEHFAADGLVFEPAPVRVRETLPTRPVNPHAQSLKLAWHPEMVDVGRAADLGYSTGPFQLSDARVDRPPMHGVFFSVWQRQSDGQWKVWLDLGGLAPAEVDATAWSRRPHVPNVAQADEHATATTITDIERGLSQADLLVRRLAVDARLHRAGMAPVIGDAWVAQLAQDDARLAYEPSEARVSLSGDLAASYGRITRTTPAGGRTSGHYVHVWLRNGGAWWLAIESLAYDKT